jgi:hypothetical protein
VLLNVVGVSAETIAIGVVCVRGGTGADKKLGSMQQDFATTSF